MKLFLVRHGETNWNTDDLVLGRTDIPLNEVGLEQARKLSRQLSDVELSEIYSSPLSRAVDTARIIAEGHNCDVKILPCLIEQDYGIFEGVNRSDESYLKNREQFFKRFEGGESYLDVAARIYPFLKEITMDKSSKRNVLIVTHGAICRMINSYFVGLDNDEFSSFRMMNCEVRRYEII